MKGQAFKVCAGMLRAASPRERRCPGMRNVEHDGLTFEYVEAKTFNATIAGADVIYFGAALHLLHLVPAKVQPLRHVEAWLDYEHALRSAVAAYLQVRERRIEYTSHHKCCLHVACDTRLLPAWVRWAWPSPLQHAHAPPFGASLSLLSTSVWHHSCSAATPRPRHLPLCASPLLSRTTPTRTWY
jgi:hypothetical protein